ncbi:helix-turn-helix domain-containing protein [Phycicoccus jejuensis]|uniref:helix-turn-helix domain-containing protein n=1 Tax=Phycicoccus jejuensis TaxID=367299 RepID=UPI0004C35F85|nr:helix-turn-helix transcriptional regulator [Phycicoccus jejuensis]
MRLLPLTYPTFARELLAARAALTVPHEVGLALRAHRRTLGLGQRAYARRRGWSASHVARLETRAGDLRLTDVVAALGPTGYCLALCHRGAAPDPEPDPDTPAPPAALPVPVSPTHWPRTELLALVRDGSRRFPAHHDTTQVTYPPNWWWQTEATRIGTQRPTWYADPSGLAARRRTASAEPSSGVATPATRDDDQHPLSA